MAGMLNPRLVFSALLFVVLFPGGADLQTADFSIQGNTTTAGGAFPYWWSLRFIKSPTTIRVDVKPPSAFTTLTALPATFPAWALKPAAMNIYRWGDVEVDPETDFRVNVYLAHWEPKKPGPTPSVPPCYPIRLKLFIEPASCLPTPWRLEKAYPLDTKIFRSGSDRDKDVAMTPAFRLGPAKATGAAQDWIEKPRRLFRNPFNYYQKSPQLFYYGEGFTPVLTDYPGDWYMPFWALYNEASKKGFWFLREDHRILTTVRAAYKEQYIGGGYSPAVINTFYNHLGDHLFFKMGQKALADHEPLGEPCEFPPFIQSGNVLIEKIDPPNEPFPSFKDYYDVINRYKGLLVKPGEPENWHPAAKGRSLSQVPQRYRDIPLVLAPAGAWDRYYDDSGPALGDLHPEHIAEIQDYYTNSLAVNTTFVHKPAFYFHGTEYAWCGPEDPVLEWGPSDYRLIRPNYQALTDWAHSAPNDGFVMAYVIPTHIPSTWSATNPTRTFDSRFVGLDIGNSRNGGYCYATSEMSGIIMDYLRNGALNTFQGTANTYVDGLHFDGIGPAGICQDHDCALHDRHYAGKGLIDIDNNGYYGILTNLFLCKMTTPPERQTPIFDQEIPLECLMDMFDSSPGVWFADPDNPPFFRMVYGNLIKYSFIIMLHGMFEMWGDHPILDLKALMPLKDGIMPVIYFFDNERTSDPHESFFNQPAGEPVKDLLRSWMVNQGFLKTIFSGEVVRLPDLSGIPSSGIVRKEKINQALKWTTVLDGTEPLIGATAFQYTDNSSDCAAVVFMSWATTYEPDRVLGKNPNNTHVTFSRGHDFEITQTLTSPSPALMAEHNIGITLTAEDLNLDKNTTYTVKKYTLDTSGSGTPVLMNDLTTSRTYTNVPIKSSRLTVIKIEPKP